MLINLLIVAAVVLVVLIIVVALRPASFCISRSITINAPAVMIFPRVNELHKWEAWSPWAKIDPNAKICYEGPPAGVGAGYTWSGNNKVGEGRMEITESRPNELVRLDLHFLRPMKANNLAEFTFESQGNKTLVTWTMTGTNNFVGKAFSMVINCDKMVGGDFEKGLAQMKSVTEATPRK